MIPGRNCLDDQDLTVEVMSSTREALMADANDDSHCCPHCEETVQEDDDFCPQCGEVFADHLSCSIHPAQSAEGVCIVCARPFCGGCGGRVNARFLCTAHSTYEIYEGMARVFGTSDMTEVELAKDSLAKEGLHPFVFSRKASPLSVGSPDYTLFRASGEYDGHIVNEFKLMVPCQEVEQAEGKLRELDFVK